MWDFKAFESKVSLRDEFGTTVTYSDLVKNGDLLGETIGGRCLVFVLCENSIGAIVGYASFVNNNIVPVMLSANLDKELLNALINIYKPKFIWAPERLKNDFNYSVKVTLYGYDLLETGFNDSYELHSDLCLMLTTSGSTGSPKFVRQSYVNVKSNANSIVEYLELDETERPITTLPLNYTYGLSIINSHLMVGATILVTDKGLIQKEFWNFLKEEKATSFGGVPYTYEMLAKLRFFRMELPYLRYMTQAGGKITTELHAKFAEYAKDSEKKFIVMYGQCEATARMGYLPAEKAIEKCGSMGIAIPGGSFKIIDLEGNVITEPLVPGELVYEGNNVTMGYAECGEDLRKGDERGGILKTGDIAQVDSEGYYYIVGRMKRFLKVYGNRVNLDEIDNMVKAKYNIMDAVSAGVDDHIYIFITDSSIADEVKNYVSSKTKLNPAAFSTVILDTIPKNESGKILYKELEKYYK